MAVQANTPRIQHVKPRGDAESFASTLIELHNGVIVTATINIVDETDQTLTLYCRGKEELKIDLARIAEEGPEDRQARGRLQRHNP